MVYTYAHIYVVPFNHIKAQFGIFNTKTILLYL